MTPSYNSGNARAGFSLVELSIVLVILGLLTGGILGGQSLIRAAELRKVTSEQEQWQTAVNTFRNKYNAIPGDFNKAADFWTPAGSGCGGTSQFGICNGNNNKSISVAESQQFWLHLAEAGLINGTFSGAHFGDEAGEDYPSSAIGGGWNVAYTYKNSNPVGAYTLGVLNGNEIIGDLTPEEIWGIDTKMDDGKPNAGTVLTWGYGCGASSTSITAEYDMQVTNNCAISFLSGNSISSADVNGWRTALDDSTGVTVIPN